MTVTSTLTELRERTRPDHDAIERHLNIIRPDLTKEEYRRLVAQFHGFYAPVEAALNRLNDAGALLPEYDQRQKTGKLHHDLEALGMTGDGIAALPLCQDIPTLDSRPAAMGCMYVLEGATLGGQIISRHVCKVLGLGPENGCAFFSSYGAELGSMWREFGKAMSAFDGSPEDRSVIGNTASATFQKFDAWLASA